MNATAPIRAFDLVEEDAQCGIERFSVTLDVIAQPLRQGRDPLAHRQARQDVIDEMGGSFRHPTGIARGADTTALAGEGDQEIVSALPTARSRKAVGQDSTLHKAAQLSFGMGRDPLIFPVVSAVPKL